MDGIESGELEEQLEPVETVCVHGNSYPCLSCQIMAVDLGHRAEVNSLRMFWFEETTLDKYKPMFIPTGCPKSAECTNKKCALAARACPWKRRRR